MKKKKNTLWDFNKVLSVQTEEWWHFSTPITLKLNTCWTSPGTQQTENSISSLLTLAQLWHNTLWFSASGPPPWVGLIADMTCGYLKCWSYTRLLAQVRIYGQRGRLAKLGSPWGFHLSLSPSAGTDKAAVWSGHILFSSNTFKVRASFPLKKKRGKMKRFTSWT